MLNSNVLKALFGGAQKIKSQNVIHVTELIRTFQLREFEELAAKSGVVKYYWVNKIKSEAYVVYEAAESATSAFKLLNGLQWPKSSAKRLQVAFSTEDEFRKIVREDAQRGGNPIAAELWKKLFPDEELVVNPDNGDEKERQNVAPQKRKDENKDLLGPLRKILKLEPIEAKANEVNEKDKKDVNLNDIDKDPLIQKIPVDELFIKTKAEPHIYYLPLIIENEEDTKDRNENGENEIDDKTEEEETQDTLEKSEDNEDEHTPRQDSNGNNYADNEGITNQLPEDYDDSVI